jgi:undecaprenyl-diphosphatase
MLETLKEIDTQWFLWINSHHTTALDWTMWTLSQHWSWAVVIVLAFVLLTLRQEPRRWWLVAIGVVLCFLLADQGSVLIKNTVCRLRPCHALEDVRMFRTHCGGQYGFVSSHAANAFAIATFLFLRYRRGKGGNNRRAMIGPILLLLWACATSYSRAYLGKHYPGDLICGALFGTLIGVLIWLAINMTEKKLHKNETK